MNGDQASYESLRYDPFHYLRRKSDTFIYIINRFTICIIFLAFVVPLLNNPQAQIILCSKCGAKGLFETSNIHIRRFEFRITNWYIMYQIVIRNSKIRTRIFSISHFTRRCQYSNACLCHSAQE